MITFPNAKINIGLQVVEKRPDGFHNLESVFYPVMLTDALEIVENNSGKLQLFSYGLPIEGLPEQNLVLKAIRLISKGEKGYDVHLKKVIPMGGGLGGGSANATFALKMINNLEDLNLSNANLFEKAMLLGSDCGFFIENQPSFVSGRGENIETLQLKIQAKWLLLVFPEIHVSTKLAFSKVTPKKSDFDLRRLPNIPIEKWPNLVENDFEKSVFKEFPQLLTLKNFLYENGALYASMSGTGSTIFGFFNDKPTLKLDYKFCWIAI